MNTKKYLIAAIVLGTALLAFAASSRLVLQTQRDAKGVIPLTSTGPSGKFGPMIEKVLPAPKTETADILNLETGSVLHQPPFERFNSSAGAIMTWIRSNRLDISCLVWSGGAACLTYDMAIVPVEGKWEEITEGELVDNPALAPGRHSPRRLLLLGPNRPGTYIFRTAEGTLGMLRIVGLSQDGRGVKIRYKLINQTKSPVSAL
jgi:hypothetical protein